MKNAGPIDAIPLKSGGYELLTDWWVDTGIVGQAARVVDSRCRGDQCSFILELLQDGQLIVRKGYHWDGASGPVIDRPSNMRASLAHDGLYQLLRQRKLGQDARAAADRVYRELVVGSGGFRVIAWIDYLGLRLFAGYAAKPQPEIEDTVIRA